LGMTRGDCRMDIADFYARRTGSAQLGTGAPAKLTVLDLGSLRLPSGKAGAATRS
jgi:hypothetical protein